MKSKMVLLKRRADALMQEGAKTFAERAAAYGPTYHVHGSIMTALFPNGVELKTKEDFNRYAILVNITTKLHRYCTNFRKGGHQDSIHDLGVYAFILEELDQK